MRMMLVLLLAPSMAAAGPSGGIRVTTDRTIDTASLESIVKDVVRLSGAKTNDEKAIAIHTWLHHAIFHHAYPVEKSPQSVGPLKAIRVYGWGLCGGQHTMLKALFETAGWKVRYRGWDGHTTIEVFYDARWHYFDVFLKCYFWTKDRKTIAGQDDINQDPSIVMDALKEGRVPAAHYLCCGDEAKGVVDGCKTSKPLPVSRHEDGWASVTGRDRGYASDLQLPSGAALRLEWKSDAGQIAVNGQGRHTCGNKDYRSDRELGPLLEHYGPRNHSNGRLAYAPDFSRAADLAGISLSGAEAKGGKLVGNGAAVFKLPLPYVYVSGQIDAAFEGDGKLSVSVDGGKTWAAAGDVSAAIKQKYDVQIKAEFSGALTKFRFDAVVEHNRSIQPHLLPGKNLVTVSPGSLQAGSSLAVTYGYQEASVADPAKRTRWDGQGVSYSAPKTTTHEGAASPWTIDVGGNTPPKMLYLEFAVRAK